jgi:L-asparagine oxygenase
MPPTTTERRTLRRLALPNAAKQDWLEEASRLVYPDPRDLAAWRVFVEASVAVSQRYFPAEMARALADFYSDAGPDALVIENLPVDRYLPPPPADGKRPASKSAVSESVIAGMIEAHSGIVSYSNEKAGAPIHEITPVAGLEHVSSSSGRAPFACHTDAAFLAPRFSPRGLLLFGLRNQPDASTAVLPLDRILEAATPALARSLEKPIFRHPAPSSFELTAAVVAPIVWRDTRGTARIAVQTHAVQPAEGSGAEEARDAISQLRELLDSLETLRVVLHPGHALLFKNDRVLHGRDAFTGERWLQRAYFTDSLHAFRERAGAADPEFVFDASLLLTGLLSGSVPKETQKTLAPSESISHSKN